MNDLRFCNLIGGKELLLSEETFDVNSPFYHDYLTKVPDSNVFDIKTAISKAKNVIHELSKLKFENRFDILKKAAKKFSLDAKDLEYVVKMTGMPISNVEEKTNDIKRILTVVPASVMKRFQIIHGKIGGRVFNDSNMFEFLEPANGLVYAVTPGNDIRVVPFVISWLVTLGMPGIIKVSKNDLLISQKLVKMISDNGYPESALNIVCWDTSKEIKKRLNFDLVDASKIVWVYGDDNTVDNLLRLEHLENNGFAHTIDHFSDKIVIRHASGRAAAVCDTNIDLDKTADIIVSSTLDWPIGCNALKAVFDANSKHEELLSILTERLEGISKSIGDPMKPNIKIGYVDSKVISHVFQRAEALKKLGLVEIKHGEIHSEIQASPLLTITKDKNSEFPPTEFPMYKLSFKSCETFNQAIREVNETAGSKRLVITIFSHHQDVLKHDFNAYHVRIFRNSTELDLPFHEGNDYIRRLSVPQIRRMGI